MLRFGTVSSQHGLPESSQIAHRRRTARKVPCVSAGSLAKAARIAQCRLGSRQADWMGEQTGRQTRLRPLGYGGQVAGRARIRRPSGSGSESRNQSIPIPKRRVDRCVLRTYVLNVETIPALRVVQGGLAVRRTKRMSDMTKSDVAQLIARGTAIYLFCWAVVELSSLPYMLDSLHHITEDRSVIDFRLSTTDMWWRDFLVVFSPYRSCHWPHSRAR